MKCLMLVISEKKKRNVCVCVRGERCRERERCVCVETDVFCYVCCVNLCVLALSLNPPTCMSVYIYNKLYTEKERGYIYASSETKPGCRHNIVHTNCLLHQTLRLSHNDVDNNIKMYHLPSADEVHNNPYIHTRTTITHRPLFVFIATDFFRHIPGALHMLAVKSRPATGKLI